MIQSGTGNRKEILLSWWNLYVKNLYEKIVMDYAPAHRGYSAREDVLSQCNHGWRKAGTAISCQQLLRQNLDWLHPKICYLACSSHCQYYCCDGAISNLACIFSANMLCKLGANTAGNMHMEKVLFTLCLISNVYWGSRGLDVDEPSDCTVMLLCHLAFLSHSSTIKISIDIPNNCYQLACGFWHHSSHVKVNSSSSTGLFDRKLLIPVWNLEQISHGYSQQ